MTQMTIPQLVKHLQLAPHPEGGWYREIHRSSTQISRADGEQRCGITTVLFLLAADQVSRWHRVIGADEVWTHLQGSPLSLYRLAGNDEEAETLNLNAEQPVQVIPASQWMAARTQGPYTLVSCCVGPGFEFADFEMLANTPEQTWPQAVIRELV